MKAVGRFLPKLPVPVHAGAGAFFVPGRMPSCGMARRTETEALALHLMRALYDSTGGRPMQWRSLAGISAGGESHEAVQLAVDRGWLLVEGGHSICLTDAGRQVLHAV